MKHVVFYDGTMTYIVSAEGNSYVKDVQKHAEEFDSFYEAQRAAASYLRVLRNDYGIALRRIQALRPHQVEPLKPTG